MARSSSSSASWPVAITPPSRTSAAGSSRMARASSCGAAGRAAPGRAAMRASSACRAAQRAAPAAAALSQRLAQADQLARAHLAQRDARGDALDVAGALELVAQRAATAPLRAGSVDGVQPLPAPALRSRRGSSSQHLSRRLPMPVMQVSSSENSVGESSPRRVCTSSRLRRVVGGRSISSSSRCDLQAAARARARGPACVRHSPAARPRRRARCASSSAPQAARRGAVQLLAAACAGPGRRRTARPGRCGQREAARRCAAPSGAARRRA